MLIDLPRNSHLTYYILLLTCVSVSWCYTPLFSELNTESNGILQCIMYEHIRSDKKLSGRRYSAGWRSLRPSRSFKVTDFNTNRKPVCDFLLVSNTNLRPISHRLRDVACYWSTIAFDRVFLENSENIAMSRILLKSRFFELHFLSQTLWVFLHHFNVIDPQICQIH